MARKRDLASKLSQPAETRPGWRDAISGPLREEVQREDATEDVGQRFSSRSQQRNPLQRKTYLLTPELVDQVAALAKAERVGINELVRFLLRSALEMVDAGQLQIPTRPAKRQIVPGEE